MTWKAIILTYFALALLAFGFEHPWALAGIAFGGLTAVFLSVIVSCAGDDKPRVCGVIEGPRSLRETYTRSKNYLRRYAPIPVVMVNCASV